VQQNSVALLQHILRLWLWTKQQLSPVVQHRPPQFSQQAPPRQSSSGKSQHVFVQQIESTRQHV
jgi:hypothetical protein